MMLKIINSIENIIEKYSDDHRFINDHELNVVCQIQTDEERIEYILAAIDQQLPAGIYFSHEYTCGEYEITFKEINGGINMEQKFMNIVDKIAKRNDDLCWADHTIYPDGQADVAFTGPRLEDYSTDEYDIEEEKFFDQMRKIESFIKEQDETYDVELIKFEADKLCPYAEVTINFKIEGGE